MGTQFDQGKLNSVLWEWKPWIKWTYCRHTQNTFPSDTLFASCTSIVDVLSKPDFSSRIDIARYVGTKINPHYTCQLTSHRRFPPMTNIRKWGADLRICATRHFCGYFFLPARPWMLSRSPWWSSSQRLGDGLHVEFEALQGLFQI